MCRRLNDQLWVVDSQRKFGTRDKKKSQRVLYVAGWPWIIIIIMDMNSMEPAS